MSSPHLSEFYENFHASRDKTGTVDIGERLSFIVQEVGTGRKVIELGCRFGGLLRYFADANEVTGCDIDRQSLAKCAQKYGVKTILANLNEELPVDDASYDVVVLSEVLEHLPYPDITLREIIRILRPGGKLIGSVPNALHLRNRLRFLLGGVVDTDPTHLQHYSSATLREQLAAYFANVRILPSGGRYIGLSSSLFSNSLLFSCAGRRERPHAFFASNAA